MRIWIDADAVKYRSESPRLADEAKTALAASVFHFANGIWTYCISWGITVGESAQKRMSYVAALADHLGKPTAVLVRQS